MCHDSLQKYQFSEVKPSQTRFREPPSFSRQLLVRVVNHTLLLKECVMILYKNISSVRSNPHRRTFEYHRVFLRVSRARSRSHTTPHTECVMILYKMSVHWVSGNRTLENLRDFLGQLLMRVVHHTLLLIRSVSRFSTNVNLVYETFTNALENYWVVLGSYSCA